MKEKVKKAALVLLPLAVVIIIYAFIGCPIKYFTGVSCPGCGMTRAWLMAFRLDFAGAFSYHPLFMLGPVLILAIYLYEKTNRKLYLVVLILLMILFFMVYFIRLFDPNDQVVTFDVQKSVLIKILRALFN
ncbi:MAG: DUF2752 domain-containing protein [Butyrivibrio sp.]|nr:DUF2752 domain-containing protein [Butyrivibrio sp.]